MPVLSVVIPAYNEAANISGALEDVLHEVAPIVPELEIIVVDDGSTDATAAVARAYAAKDVRIRVRCQANQGHGPALLAGLESARGDWLLLIDSDRQVSLQDFGRHWELSPSYDAILGLRTPRRDPLYRKAISACMRILLWLQLGVWVGDGGAPYKLVRAEVWRAARDRMRVGCWIPSVLLAAATLQHDLRVLQVPIVHRLRTAGPSTLNLQRLGRFCREGMKDIAHFRQQSSRPTAAATGE